MTEIILGLITGTLIGLVGVGGILLAPLLVFFLDMDIHSAMATCSWSFLFTGLTGSFTYARKKSVSWPMVLWISIGIIPGAVLGAVTNADLSKTTLLIILALLIGFSGVHALFKKMDTTTPPIKLKVWILGLIGFGLGFGSALTGTGGPVLLIPILLFLHFPVLKSIGVSQVIQLPIALFATLGFYFDKQVDIDFALGTKLGVVQALAVFLGAYIAHRISTRKLQKIVAVILIGVACFMLFYK